MAWTDFYMITGTGSNLYSGSTSSGTPIYSSLTGTWDGSANFTPTDGSTPYGTVNVGDWCSVYANAAAAAPYVAQVTAVATGANGVITLSTTAKIGTVPASGTSTRNLVDGGAWADLGVVTSMWTTGTISTSTRVNIKAGTYANTTNTRTVSVAGTATAPIWWRGYKTTPGDQDGNSLAVAGTDIPSITFTTGYLVLSGTYNIISNVDLTSSNASQTGALQFTAANCIAYHVRAANTNANAWSYAFASSAAASTIVCCSFTATTTATQALSFTSVAFVVGSVVVGGIIGVKSTASITILNVVLSGQAGDSIYLGGGPAILSHNSIYGPLGNGVNISSVSTQGVLVVNNYFENVNQSGKAAINNTSGTNSSLIRCVGNAYYNCTANTAGLTEGFTIFDLGTLASAGFVAGATGNFAPASVLQGIGFPGVFETVSAYRGYLTPGAAQPNPSGGGTGRQPKLRCLGV